MLSFEKDKVLCGCVLNCTIMAIKKNKPLIFLIICLLFRFCFFLNSVGRTVEMIAGPLGAEFLGLLLLHLVFKRVSYCSPDWP